MMDFAIRRVLIRHAPLLCAMLVGAMSTIAHQCSYEEGCSESSIIKRSSGSLSLIQKGAKVQTSGIAAKKTARKDVDESHNEDMWATEAHDAAEQAMIAAKAAADATEKVVKQNIDLRQENARLRESPKSQKKEHQNDLHHAHEGNTSINLVVKQVLRTIPAHRMGRFNTVALDIEYNSRWEEAMTFPQRKPWATNVIIATTKTFLADFVVQASNPTVDKAGFHFDWRRSLLFTTFGFFYVGMAQWFFYVSWFSRMCPDALAFANKPFAMKLNDKVGWEELLVQVATDQFFITPWIYFPIFYILKEVLLDSSADSKLGSPIKERFGRAYHFYRENFKKDNLTSLAVWFPADFVIFTAPMYLRMPLDHAVAFIWTMFLSYMRGGGAKKE